MILSWNCTLHRKKDFCIVKYSVLKMITGLDSKMKIASKFTVGMVGIDHWNSKLSTNVHCEKSNHSAFLTFQEICKKNQQRNYISDTFWTFKSKLQIIHAATYIHCFFLTLINVFFMFSTIHLSLSLLFSHFLFLFSPSFSYSSRHKTHSTIYNVSFDFITTWP